MALVLAWIWGSGYREEVDTLVFGEAQGKGTLPWTPGAQGQAAQHTYAFVVVVVLGTQAWWELGRRPEKPGGGLLMGGTRPGGGGGGVPFRSTTVLKPVGVAHQDPKHDPRWPGTVRPHSLVLTGYPAHLACQASIQRPYIP